MYMEYMVVWLHDFTDTYYSVHGFDQIDDAEAFYQKLATNNPNIFSCLGKVEIVEQQFTLARSLDGRGNPSKIAEDVPYWPLLGRQSRLHPLNSSLQRISGMTHVRTSPFYPQSNGKLERRHKSLKSECIRPLTPLT